MKLYYICLLLLVLTLWGASVKASGFVQAGEASWYGSAFHGQTTASGETYNMYELSAAHKFLPLGSKVRVTNLANEKSVVLRINDRGPYVKGRIIDLSKAAARELGMHDRGTAPVRIEVADTAVGVTREGDVQGIFFVHLATFSQHEPAMKLFKRLREHNNAPRLLQITDPQGITAHVQLGPFTALSEAKTALKTQEKEFPEAYVMAELEGASLRTYLRANGQEKAATQLAARQRKLDIQYKQTAERKESAKKKRDAKEAEEPPQLPDTKLQGLAPCGFPLQAGQESGFFVQLAIYNLLANAEALLQNLKNAKYPLRIVQTDTGQRTTYMVQAGPFEKRSLAAESLKLYRDRLRDAFVLPGERIETKDSCIVQALAGE